MKGVNYLTNDKGEKIALQIDLKNHDSAIDDYLEEIQDIIDVRNSVNEPRVEYEKARKKLLKKKRD